MMLKRNSSQSKRSAWTLLRAGLAGLAVMVGGAAVTGGCLDRPVAPAVPRTSNVYVDEIRQTAVDKIDLLFMIDNSISMADKQAILADAVPLLVQRLITPSCVRPCTAADNCSEAQEKDGIPVDGNAGTGCPNGSAPEFNPIKDIHVGVVTSSLGSHGASGANDVCTKPTDDDHAHLLGEIRNTRDGGMLKPYDANGFLKWDTTNPPKYTPAGDSEGTAFTAKFTDMVKSAGEGGCGYEASLEAWYRFLVDPEPPASIVMQNNLSVPSGVDTTLLAQRRAFLRPDSVLAIVTLSDENDCSITDEGYGWLISRATPMFRSTSACENPNDACCQSCGEVQVNPGCPPITSDPECAKGSTYPNTGADTLDNLNLRCFDQKGRFGFDLLLPISRYRDGLTRQNVFNRQGEVVPNPIFSGDGPRRHPSQVIYTGIVGVPWQDLADEASLKGAGLSYLSASELTAQKRWEVIVGDPEASPPVRPTDPFMIEATFDRAMLSSVSGNPITRDSLVPATSMNPQANAINGHEVVTSGSRLQAACIFPLQTPMVCDQAAQDALKSCHCYQESLSTNDPVCQPPGGGAPDITQYASSAFPGTRHLRLQRTLGDVAVSASICPKVSNDSSEDFGYRPAMRALAARIEKAFNP
jgi:hypothetical protein